MSNNPTPAPAVTLACDAQHEYTAAIMRGIAPDQAREVAAAAIADAATSQATVAEACAFLERLALRADSRYPGAARLCRTLAEIVETAGNAPRTIH